MTGLTEGDPAVLTILGQTLSGSFVFEQKTNNLGEKVIRLGASDVGLDFGGIVTVSKGSGSLLITQAGIAGAVEATIGLNVPGVTFNGTFKLSINNTNAIVNDSITVGGKTIVINMPAGPYLRVEGVGVKLSILGQTLSGDFAFERVTTDPGPDMLYNTQDDVRIVRIGASNVGLSLGDGTTAFVSVTQGQGSFVITSAGMAGQLSAAVSVNVPGVSFNGKFSIAINNTTDEVNETFRVGDVDITLILPAGPYLKVDITGIEEGTPAELTVLGQTLKGNFSFEQSTTSENERIVRIAASAVELHLGDGTTDYVSVTNGEALFLITSAGFAGKIEASVSLTIPDPTADTGFSTSTANNITVAINNTGQAVDAQFEVGNETKTLTLPSGPYLLVQVEGLDLIILGQTIHGNFAFEKRPQPTAPALSGSRRPKWK